MFLPYHLFPGHFQYAGNIATYTIPSSSVIILLNILDKNKHDFEIVGNNGSSLPDETGGEGGQVLLLTYPKHPASTSELYNSPPLASSRMR